MEQKRERIVFEAGMFFLAVISIWFWAVGVKSVLLILLGFCVAQRLLSKNFYFDKETIFLFMGMFVYSIGSQLNMGWLIKFTLLPVLFYDYGKSVIMIQNREECEKRTRIVIIIVSLGLFAGSVLNAVSWYQYGFEGGRAWREFWTGQTLPATQHVYWSLFIVALIFYGICYWKKSCLINSILVLGGLWSVWFSLVTGSRIIVLIFGIVLFINIILYCYFNWQDERKRGYIKKGLIGIIVLSVLLTAAYMLNLGGIFDPIKKSYMWTRNGGILHNIRFQAQLTILKQLFVHPFGGRKIEAELYYAHNVWLDMANSGGVLPFILILIYTILSVMGLFKLLQNPDISQEIKYLLVSVYISLFLYFMVEPALDANLMCWVIWMLICGLVKGNLVQKSNLSKKGHRVAVDEGHVEE